MTGQQMAARGAGEAVLEDALQPVQPDLGVGGVAPRGVGGLQVGGDRAHRADDLVGHVGDGRAAIGALGQWGPVAGQQRAARRQRDDAVKLFALAHAGEEQRVGEVHPGAGARTAERYLKGLVQRAPQLGRDDHRHRDVVAVAAGDAHAAHRFLGRDVAGGLHPSGEPALAHLALGDAVEQRVHLGVVLVMPRGDVARHHLALLVARAHGQEHPAHERRHREHGDGQGPCEQALPPSPPFPGPRSTRHDHPALCHLQTQGRQCAARIDRSGRLFARLQGRLSVPSPTTLSR